MRKKTEESRNSYNQMALEYDTSDEVRYTAFYIDELVNSDVVLDIKTPGSIQFNYSSADFAA